MCFIGLVDFEIVVAGIGAEVWQLSAISPSLSLSHSILIFFHSVARSLATDRLPVCKQYSLRKCNAKCMRRRTMALIASLGPNVNRVVAYIIIVWI